MTDAATGTDKRPAWKSRHCERTKSFMAVSSAGVAFSGRSANHPISAIPRTRRNTGNIARSSSATGLTLQYLLRNLAGRNPRSLEVCALLIKPSRREVDLDTKYVGFEIPDRFAIGYGLDHDERYRNLPYVAALND